MFGALFLLGIGAALRAWAPVPDGAERVLDWVAIRVLLPCLALAKLSQIDLTAATFMPALFAWFAAAVGAGAVLLIGRWWPERTRRAALLVAVLGNTSFFGIPALRSLLGSATEAPALVYDQLGTFLLLATYGTFVSTRSNTGTGSVRARSGLSGVVRSPAAIASVCALSLAGLGIGLPDWLLDALGPPGAALAPVALLSLGLRIRAPIRFGHPSGLVGTLAIKMLLMPAAALVGIVVTHRLMGWNPALLDARVIVMESAMPPMVTASVYAIDAGFDEETAVASVVVGLIAALLTLPMWAWVTGVTLGI